MIQMGWKETYESRLMSGEEAVKLIQSGDDVVLSHCINEPEYLIDCMVKNHDAYKGVKVHHMVSNGPGEYVNEEYKDNFFTEVWFGAGNSRKAIAAGNGDIVPVYFYEIPILMRKGIINVDVLLLQVTPPDENGKVSTGVSADYTVQALRSARTVIAQVNNNVPFTYGDAIFDVDEIDAFVEHDEDLFELPKAKIGPTEEAIGKYCAELVNDGDCLQLGIGAIPDAVCHELGNKKNLGIHSEMLGDGPIFLYEQGAINGSEKDIDTGKMVFNFAMGSRKTYDFLDHNENCLMRTVDYVNHPMVVCQNKNNVSINSAIEVDFYGQVAADMIGYRQFSGVGGQVDFIRGAQMAENGRAIIAMPSVTVKKDGTKLSKIKPLLTEGACVTTNRFDVDYVVTEYGIARMKGVATRERAKALIKIAHPEFRAELVEKFNEMFPEKISLSDVE